MSKSDYLAKPDKYCKVIIGHNVDIQRRLLWVIH